MNQYTAQDLGNQRAAGIEETRLDIGEKLLALVHDTIQKINSDQCDGRFLLEDLLARLVTVSMGLGADPALFHETAGQYEKNVISYPMLGSIDHEFEADHSPGSCTVMVMRDGFGDACGNPPEAHKKGNQ